MRTAKSNVVRLYRGNLNYRGIGELGERRWQSAAQAESFSRHWWSPATELYSRIDRHRVLTLAAALSFYTALSLSPLLIILFWLVGSLGFRDQRILIEQVVTLVGPEAGRMLQIIVENTRETLSLNSMAGLLGFITLVVSAASVFGQLQMSLNTIFEVEPPKNVSWWAWLQKRLLSIGMVFSIGFLAIVSLFANTAIAFVAERWWKGTVPLQVAEAFLSLGLFVVFFTLLYKLLPDRRLSWKDTVLGGALTAVLFIIGKTAIGFYLGQTSMGSAYGAAGSLIILLVWVYYSSAVVLIGAEITAQWRQSVQPIHVERGK